MIGRAYLYGLGAGRRARRRPGARLVPGDLRRTMALLGVTSIDEITADHIRRRP